MFSVLLPITYFPIDRLLINLDKLVFWKAAMSLQPLGAARHTKIK